MKAHYLTRKMRDGLLGGSSFNIGIIYVPETNVFVQFSYDVENYSAMFGNVRNFSTNDEQLGEVARVVEGKGTKDFEVDDFEIHSEQVALLGMVENKDRVPVPKEYRGSREQLLELLVKFVG
jgi:hypothetical protein